MGQYATALLTHKPSESRLSKIAYHIATTYFKGQNYTFSVVRDVPQGLDINEEALIRNEMAIDSNKVLLIVHIER